MSMPTEPSVTELSQATRPVAQLMDLTGRRALVTGGAGHIGRVISEALVEQGATVAILDQDAAACQHHVAQLAARSKRSEAFALPCDLRSEPATRQAIHDAEDRMGGLEILVHCAAYLGTTDTPGWAVPLDRQTVEAWDAAMRVNLTSAMILVQEAAQALAASGHGSVIFLSSIYGMVAPDLRLYAQTDMANPAGYAASKGGLLQLMRYFATVLAPQIRVNAISPGGIWRNQPEAFRARYVSRTPLGRMATEEDLKGAVSYLASDLSAYVTGHNLVVDGGWTAW